MLNSKTVNFIPLEFSVVFVGFDFKTSSISDSALIDNEIIQSDEEINYPLYSIVANNARVPLKNGISFELSPLTPFTAPDIPTTQRLAIRGKHDNINFISHAASKLLHSFLDRPKINNIGINFSFELIEINNIDHLFNNSVLENHGEYQTHQISLYKKDQDGNTVTIVLQLNLVTRDKIRANFNFNSIHKSQELTEIDINFAQRIRRHLSEAESIINDFNAS